MKDLKYSLLFFLLLMRCFVSAQDSTAKIKLTINDVNLHLVGLVIDPALTFAQVSQLTHNSALPAEAKGYQRPSFDDTYMQGDLGICSSFLFKNAKRRMVRRIKPRLGFYYGQRMFGFDYLSFSKTTRIDSLYFTDPSVAPTIIDSVYEGRMSYKFTSSLLSLELGANVDVITRERSNFYAGFAFVMARSFHDEFLIHKTEYYMIDKYPDQAKDTYGEVKNYSLREKSSGASLYRIAAVLGVQHRFHPGRNYSGGFFSEFRLGRESFKIKKGQPLSYGVFFMSIGLRFSFQKHK